VATGLPNTDPMLGKLNKSAEETNALNKEIKAAGIDTSEAISEQLSLISSFTEVMKNYIPKLGFIDAHTQALKLKQDSAFKVLESIDETLKTQAEQVEAEPEEAEAERADLEELPAGDAVAMEEAEDARDGGDGEKVDTLERIADDVAAIRMAAEAGSEDGRDPLTEPEVDGGGNVTGGDKKEKKKKGPLASFLKSITKLFSVVGLIVMGLVAALLTGSSGLFTAIKSLFETVMKIFTMLVGIVIEKVLPVVTEVFTLIIGIIEQLLPPIMDIVSVIIEVVMGVVESLIGPIMSIVDMLVPIIIEIVNVVLEVIMSVVDVVMPILDQFIQALLPIIEMVLDVMMLIFDYVLRPLLAVLAPVVESVGDLMMSFFNMLIWVWNGLLEAAASFADWIPGLDAQAIRDQKMDMMEKNTAKDEAENIDFSQADETVNEQIQAKLDAGEINKTTAESLMKDKAKYREKAEKKRQSVVQGLKTTEATVPDALKKDGEELKLISMDLSGLTDGATGKVLVDPNSVDGAGNYRVYDEEGNPLTFPDESNEAVMMGIHAGVENLAAKEAGSEEESFSMEALLGLDADAGGQGLDLASESLDSADAQADAAAGDGGNNEVNVSTQGGSQSSSISNKTIIMNDGASGDPQSPRGWFATPN